MANEDQPARAPGVIYWIGMACERARLAAKPSFKRSRVAGELGRGEQVVIDFERGKHVPRELNELLTIYGRLTNHEPWELLQSAVKLWRAEGTAPGVRPPDEEGSAPRAPKTLPRPPDMTPQKASDGHPKRRRKAS